MMRNVDMITITIGGNDAGFADILRACVDHITGDGRCDDSDVGSDVNQIGDLVATVIAELRDVAPRASIFVLGYPYVTPNVGACADPDGTYVPGVYSWDEELVLVHESDTCAVGYGLIQYCSALSALDVVTDSFGVIGGTIFSLFGDFRISFSEARFLSEMADELNENISDAARESGAHFVDVVNRSTRFVGHSPCDSEPCLHGYVDKPGVSLLLDSSDRSFHPNVAGHNGYADILDQYIRTLALVEGVELNEAGLPVNPVPQPGTSRAVRSTRNEPAKTSGSPTRRTSTSETGDGDEAVTPEATFWYLIPQRVTAVTGCSVGFVSPGEQIGLTTTGFAANTTVSFTVEAVSLDGSIAPAAVSETVDVNVLGNDHDLNENLDPSSLAITRQPVAGTATVVVASDGRTVVEYAAPASGDTTTFAYQVCDTLNSCTTGEVTVMAGTSGCTIEPVTSAA